MNDSFQRPIDTGLLADPLNHQIVQALRKDGRTPSSEIAQKLGVSEGTIRNRVGAMRSAGVLRIAAITDASAEEYRTEAILGIKIAPGHDPAETAARLSQIDDIVYVAWISGRYDLLVEVVSTDEKTLLQLLSDRVHCQADIASVEVMTGMKNFKNQFLLKSNWG